MSELVRVERAELEELASVAERLRKYLEAGEGAPATLRAYRKDWDLFSEWCGRVGLVALPALPETVALYLTAHDHLKPSTLDRRLSSIAVTHEANGFPKPTKSKGLLKARLGLRRELGTAQRRAAPATTDVLRTMVEGLGEGLRATRDRALLLLGFAAALRRSELVALDVADVEEVLEGLNVTIRRSKTDQEGAGEVRAVPYGSNLETCPVRSVKLWLAVAGIDGGPVFRRVDRHGNLGRGRLSDRAVALVVKERAAAAGLDPSRFSGHSLRAGLATEGGRRGLPERDIQRQTGHKTVTVLRGYIRDGDRWRDNVAGKVGL